MPAGPHWLTLQCSTGPGVRLIMGCIGRPLVPIVAAMSTERPLGAAWHVEWKKGPLSPSFYASCV